MGGSIEQWLNEPQTKPASPGAKRGSIEEWMNSTSQTDTLRTSIDLSDPTRPDLAAKIKFLQEKTGLDSGIIGRNVEEVSRRAMLSDFDPERFAQDFPDTAKWLGEQPEHASVALDDVSKLGGIERLLKAVKRGMSIGISETQIGNIHYKEMEGQVLSERDRTNLTKLEENIKKEPTGFGFFSNLLYKSSKMIGQMANVLPDAVIGAEAGAVSAGGIVAISAAAGVSVAAGPEILAGAGIGALAGTAISFFKSTAGSTYNQLKSARGPNGERINETSAQLAAIGSGSVAAVLTVLGGNVVSAPFKAAGRQLFAKAAEDALVRPTMLAALRDLGLSYTKSMAVGTGIMVTQEVSNVVVEELAKMTSEGDWATVLNSPEAREMAVKRIAMAAREAVEAMALISVPGAFTHGASTAYRARVAERQANYFRALGERVAESATFKRLPREVQRLVEMQTKDGPLENVYIPVSVWNEHWQSKGFDPGSVAETVLGERKTWESASEHGGDLQIPTAKYATAIAPTEHNVVFAQELRTNPLQMSAREAREAVKLEAQKATVLSEVEQSSENVRAVMLDKLKAAGFNEDEAAVHAEAYRRFFFRLGEKTQKMPEELFKEANIGIERREAPSGKGMPQSPRVVSAAVQMPDGRIFTGAIHGDAWDAFQNATGEIAPDPADFQHLGIREGFVLNDGRFLDRVETDRMFNIDPSEAEYPDAGVSISEHFSDTIDRNQVPREFHQAGKEPSAVPDLPPGFFSKAERLIEEKMGKSASVDEVRAILSGAKKEELKWLNIEDFLKYQEEKYAETKDADWLKISKQEMQDYLRANRLKIVEKTPDYEFNLDEHAITEFVDEVVQDNVEMLMDEIEVNIKKDGTVNILGWGSASEHQIKGLTSWVGELNDSKYLKTLGSEARHEHFSDALREKLEMDYYDDRVLMEELRDDAIESLYDGQNPTESEYKRYTLPGGENYREILFTLPDMADDYYESQHYPSEGPIFAWARVNDRVGAGGEKILHIEEIQSDWHQAGREHGYDTGGKKESLTPEEINELDRVSNLIDPRSSRFTTFPSLHEAAVAEQKGRISAAEYRSFVDLLRKEQNEHSVSSGVPDAPFRATWHEFVFKRMLREAAEKGYDAITWTTGDQQNARYSLEKVAKDIRATPVEGMGGPIENQVFRLEAFGHNDYRIYDRRVPFKELGDHIGKELAVKLMAQEPTTDATPVDGTRVVRGEGFHSDQWLLVDDNGKIITSISDPNEQYTKEQATRQMALAANRLVLPENTRSLRGDALKFGGHGMRGFYDEMLVRFAKDFGKKFKMKPEDMKIEAWSDDVGERFGITDEIETTQQATVHGMVLTPELRISALENEFTLFQNKPTIEEALANIKERLARGDVSMLTPERSRIKPSQHLETSETRAMAMWQKLLEMKKAKGAHDFQKSVLKGQNLSPDLMIEWDRGDSRQLALHYMQEGGGNFRLASDKMWTDSAAMEYVVTHLDGKDYELVRESMQEVTWETEGRIASLTGDEQLLSEYKNKGAFYKAFVKGYNAQERDLHLLAQQQVDGSTARGLIRIGDSSINIELLKNADPSTFIHETGHLFLHLLEKHAQDADFQAIKKWLGVKGDKFTRKHHEMFARGWEKYAMEGRAPTPALQTVFKNFKEWLRGVYKTLRDLNVELTDEVRRVFDRMLMSQEEIDAVNKARPPLFGDLKKLGLDDATAKSYGDAIQRANIAAEEEVTAQIMKEWKQEQTRVFQAEREKVYAGVAEEADNNPVMMAHSLLKYGKTPSGVTPAEKPFKLNRADVIAEYGNDVARAISKSLSNDPDSSLHPDMAADVLGISSGQALVKLLENGDDPIQWIERNTNARMRGKKSQIQMLTAAEIPTEATRAAHNEKRAQLLRKELEILSMQDMPTAKGIIKRLSRRIPAIEEVRNQARSMVEEQIVRNVAANTYLRAEQRAANAAIDAFNKGDIQEAFNQKQSELLNHELYRAAANAQEFIQKAANYMQRFDRKEVRQRLGLAGADYLEQIDAIRERFDFKYASGPALDRKQSLKEFLTERQNEGFRPDIPDELINEMYRKNFRELTVAELRGIHESTRQIEHLARLKNKLLASAKNRSLEQVRTSIVERIRQNFNVKPEGLDYAPGLRKRVGRLLNKVDAGLTQPEFLFKYLDGHEANGPAWNAFFKPIQDAETAENMRFKTAQTELVNIFNMYTKAERAQFFWKKYHIPELDTSLTKPNILAIALNQGNLYNREALLVGHEKFGWTEAGVQAALNLLDQRDWDFVQRVWDHMESYWPDIAKLEKKLTGLEPGKVEPTEVVTKFGTYRGGYYPIMFDKDLSWRQAFIAAEESTHDLFGGRGTYAATKHGHTKERVGTGGKPLQLTLSPIFTHVANVIHDLSYREAIIDVNRLVNDPEIRANIEGSVGREMYGQLHPWLVAVAKERRTEPANVLENLLARGRNGATIVHLGWRLSSALVQTTNYTVAVKELGSKYALKALNDVYGNPLNVRKMYKYVTDQSPYMRDRFFAVDRDIRETMKNMNLADLPHGPMSALNPYIQPGKIRNSFFWFISSMDMGVALPAWVGGFRKAMDGKVKGIEAMDAIASRDYADSLVREAFSAGALKDMAGLQRGSPLWMTFVMFYTSMGTVYNQMKKTGQEYKLTKNFGKLAAGAALTWFLPAVLSEIVTGRTPSLDDDPEEWGKWLAQTGVKWPLSTVPILRDLAYPIVHGKGDYHPSAAFDVPATIVKAVQAMQKHGAEIDDYTRHEWQQIVDAAGYFLELPTRQLWLTLESIFDFITGEKEVENVPADIFHSLISQAEKQNDGLGDGTDALS